MSKQKYPQKETATIDGVAKKKGRESYSRIKINAKRDRKRREAEDRQFKYDNLTLKEKLAQLGDTGSMKQRKRLEKQITAEKEAKKTSKKNLTSTDKVVKS